MKRDPVSLKDANQIMALSWPAAMTYFAQCVSEARFDDAKVMMQSGVLDFERHWDPSSGFTRDAIAGLFKEIRWEAIDERGQEVFAAILDGLFKSQAASEKIAVGEGLIKDMLIEAVMERRRYVLRALVEYREGVNRDIYLDRHIENAIIHAIKLFDSDALRDIYSITKKHLKPGQSIGYKIGLDGENRLLVNDDVQCFSVLMDHGWMPSLKQLIENKAGKCFQAMIDRGVPVSYDETDYREAVKQDFAPYIALIMRQENQMSGYLLGKRGKNAFPAPLAQLSNMTIRGAGKINCLREFINAGVHPDRMIDGGGKRLIVHAVQCNQVEMVTMMIEAGAVVFTKTDYRGAAPKMTKEIVDGKPLFVENWDHHVLANHDLYRYAETVLGPDHEEMMALLGAARAKAMLVNYVGDARKKVDKTMRHKKPVRT